jgi:uncharacterized protein YndB with AHSA1/START domain
MNDASLNQSAEASDRRLIFTRLLDEPRDLVFDM